MTVGLDTSVVLRLLIGEPAAQAETAHRLLSERTFAGNEPAHVSDLVVAESYFALRHHYAVPHAKAVAALKAFLADPRVHPTGASPEVLDQLSSSHVAPGFIDRLIHGDYRRLGVGLVTFDRDAARLADATLIA